VREISKNYRRAFLLEPTKLRRLIEIIHDRLCNQQHTAYRDSFEVFMCASHREDMNNVEDVLALDNSNKRKIQRLVIVSSATMVGTATPDREVQVDFASPRVVDSSGSTTTQTVIAITVRSDDGTWASATLSEVEEQVERTWLPYIKPVLILCGIAIFLLFVLLWQATPLRQANWSSLWLQGADLDRVGEIVGQQRIISDQELREIVTRQLRNYVQANRPAQSTNQNGWQTWFITIPILAVLGCVVVLVATWGTSSTRTARSPALLPATIFRKFMEGFVAYVRGRKQSTS
jgi:hypothetical protein